MLVTRPEFRTLMFVPDSCKNTHDFFNNSPYEMMEVNALWVGPAIKTVPMQLRFWTQLVLDIFLCRKRYLLLMSNPKNKAIQSIHRMTSQTSLSTKGRRSSLAAKKATRRSKWAIQPAGISC